jgi:hypothetical protein
MKDGRHVSDVEDVVELELAAREELADAGAREEGSAGYIPA